MEKNMKQFTRMLAILTALLWLMNRGQREGLLLSLAVTASTFVYHAGMRLLTGTLVNSLMHNRADCYAPWFRPRRWEKRLYFLLGVRRWKKMIQAFDPELFDLRKHSLEEIAQAMCQAEIVHEIIVPLSFLPILASPYVGGLPAFLITSILAASFDLCLAIIQRYNRPRVLRLLEKRRNRFCSGSVPGDPGQPEES